MPMIKCPEFSTHGFGFTSMQTDREQRSELERAADMLVAAESLAALTGAGISAESGLATFRGADGLWEGHRVEDVATPFAFERDPVLVWRFYHARRAALRQARPNPGHIALAEIERLFGKERFTLITQNVDGLHRAAGSENVVELHGNLARVCCTGCGQVADRGALPLDELPRCDECGQLLRPDVVWFYEPLPAEHWARAERAAAACRCLLIVGTSAVVYPAAGLIDVARRGGARVIEINIAATAATGTADISLFGPSGQILPELVKRMKYAYQRK
jgi:NAD-dependent deacetylase